MYWDTQVKTLMRRMFSGVSRLWKLSNNLLSSPHSNRKKSLRCYISLFSVIKMITIIWAKTETRNDNHKLEVKKTKLWNTRIANNKQLNGVDTQHGLHKTNSIFINLGGTQALRWAAPLVGEMPIICVTPPWRSSTLSGCWSCSSCCSWNVSIIVIMLSLSHRGGGLHRKCPLVHIIICKIK